MQMTEMNGSAPGDDEQKLVYRLMYFTWHQVTSLWKRIFSIDIHILSIKRGVAIFSKSNMAVKIQDGRQFFYNASYVKYYL